jgi:hypothetical protein
MAGMMQKQRLESDEVADEIEDWLDDDKEYQLGTVEGRQLQLSIEGKAMVELDVEQRRETLEAALL